MAASAAAMQYNTDLPYSTLVHHPKHFAEYTTDNIAKATQLQNTKVHVTTYLQAVCWAAGFDNETVVTCNLCSVCCSIDA